MKAVPSYRLYDRTCGTNVIKVRIIDFTPYCTEYVVKKQVLFLSKINKEIRNYYDK